jgi:hypothetical protein
MNRSPTNLFDWLQCGEFIYSGVLLVGTSATLLQGYYLFFENSRKTVVEMYGFSNALLLLVRRNIVRVFFGYEEKVQRGKNHMMP